MQNLEKVISCNPVTDPKSKFEMVEMLLGDDPLMTFKQYRNGVCH